MTEAESTEPQTLLALPAPTDATDAQKVEFNSEAIAKLSFDKLGPMVVNSDGTLSRITNWDKMIPLERERTMRVLNARNRLRLANEGDKSQSTPDAERLSISKDVTDQS